MIVIPKDVEEKYKDRISKCHSFSSSFKIRTGDKGESAKAEGMRVGENMIRSRSIEAVC